MRTVAEYDRSLPLDVIMLVISELLPKVQNLQSSLSGASASNAIIDLLRNANLDQVLPKPPPLSPRRFMVRHLPYSMCISGLFELAYSGRTPR